MRITQFSIRCLILYKESIERFLIESVKSDSIFCILISEQKFERRLKGDKDMKGYTVESGYMGYVNGEYMLFASETDYVDYMEK